MLQNTNFFTTIAPFHSMTHSTSAGIHCEGGRDALNCTSYISLGEPSTMPVSVTPSPDP